MLDMLQGLLDAAAEIRRNRDVRVVVLQGKGDSFCAGLDFAAGRQEQQGAARAVLHAEPAARHQPASSRRSGRGASCRSRSSPSPEGTCSARGIQLALAADFRFTTPDCQWSVLEAKWGLVPDMSGTVPLAELTTADVAKRLVMTAEVFSGEQAVEYGLATGAAEDPMKPALELVDALLARSPDSVSASKKLLNRSRRGGLRGAFRRERRYQLQMLRSANAKIARKAGTSRTEPEFRPRSFD